jgi:hypothetical protein
MKSGSLNLLERSGSVQACNGIGLPLPLPFFLRWLSTSALGFTPALHEEVFGLREEDLKMWLWYLLCCAALCYVCIISYLKVTLYHRLCWFYPYHSTLLLITSVRTTFPTKPILFEFINFTVFYRLQATEPFITQYYPCPYFVLCLRSNSSPYPRIFVFMQNGSARTVTCTLTLAQECGLCTGETFTAFQKTRVNSVDKGTAVIGTKKDPTAEWHMDSLLWLYKIFTPT